MGNSIDKIDEGFFICGVEALADRERLKSLGITHIMNAAYMDLYRHRHSDSSGVLQSLPDHFKVKSLECEDSEDCNLSVHFYDLADFIEEGRRAGGVVVHCAAGISRASTSSCAYLMIKQNLSLDAAFFKVHSARDKVHPNSGFWRQLRDLEAVLRLKGADLQPLAADALTAPRPKKEAEGEDKSDEDYWDRYQDNSDFAALLASLNSYVGRTRPFATHFLAARLDCAEGTGAAELRERLRGDQVAGVVWNEMEPKGETSLWVRANVVPSMDSAAFKALLESFDGVRSATCE